MRESKIEGVIWDFFSGDIERLILEHSISSDTLKEGNFKFHWYGNEEEEENEFGAVVSLTIMEPIKKAS